MKKVLNDPDQGVKWLLAGILLTGVLLFAVNDLLMQRAAPVWDALDFYAPYFSLVADHARASQLLIWDPWLDAGLPDFADPQGGASSPIILLFALLFNNPFQGFIAYWVTLWAFGGIGMLILCRHLKAPVWGGVVVALGFMACGFYTGHGEHTSIIYSLSFIPWILWRFDVSLVRRNYWGAVEAGVLWGLSALGGYPQLVILDVMFLGAWAIGCHLFQRNEMAADPAKAGQPKLVFVLLSLILLGTLGSIILSPSYYSFFEETRGFTTRANGVDRQYALTSNDLPPQALSTLSSPYLYQLNLPPYRIWPESDVAMCNIYAGALPIIFGILALLRRSSWRIWLALTGSIFLGCAVGNHLPIRGWLYDYAPPTRYFRNPSLFAPYAILVLWILAAYATRDLEESWTSGSGNVRNSFFLIGAGTPFLAWFCYLHILHRAGLTVASAPFASLQVSVVWLSVAIISFLIWRRVFRRPLLCWVLVAISVVDAGSTLYISKPTLFSPYTVAWWKATMRRHNTNLDLTASGLVRNLHPPEDLGTYPNNRNSAIKESNFYNLTELVNPFFQEFASNPELSEFATGSNRIWFSGKAVWITPTQNAFEKFAEVVRRLSAPVLVLHTREQMLSGSVLPESGTAWATEAQAMVQAEIHLTSYRPNSMAFQYRADEDGWLLVTDRWSRSWTATVNGKTREVQAADFIFRAVPVTKGDNTVVFRYNPTWYVPMVALSWLTILFCLIISMWGAVHRKAGLRVSGPSFD